MYKLEVVLDEQQQQQLKRIAAFFGPGEQNAIRKLLELADKSVDEGVRKWVAMRKEGGK